MENLLDNLRLAIGRIKTFPKTLSQPALIAILIICLLFIFGSLLFRSSQRPKNIISAKNENISKTEKATNGSEKRLIIYICGAVRKPGVYEMLPGSRVIDALKKAGNELPEAQIEVLNLASQLSDGQKIYVPKKGEIKPEQNSFQASSEERDLININQADGKQIEELPGIGPVIAGRIVEYRKKYGFFKKVEDLKKVEGIGLKKFENLKDCVTVD